MKQTFLDINISRARLAIIEEANAILEEYAADGYDLSLRQLYYQFVVRELRENSERSYKNLGDIITDGRNAGLIDWDMIKDRGRECSTPVSWDSPNAILDSAARQYKMNLWETQPCHIEVMVEKDALSGVLEPVCQKLRIAFSANKGYSSSSALYEAGLRLHDHLMDGKRVLVLYMGDHDPSGIDMTRDVEERLRLYADDKSVEVRRLALNMDQVERYNPPPNPTKLTDSRANGYIARFGDESWELDALEPRTMAQLVEDAVEEVRDIDLWAAAMAMEKAYKADLVRVAREYKPPKLEAA